MSWRLTAAVGFLLGFALTLVVASLRGHSNYDDCMLEKLRGGMTREAVFLVESACRAKFVDRPASEKWQRASEYWGREASALRAQVARLWADSASREQTDSARHARLQGVRAKLDSAARAQGPD